MQKALGIHVTVRARKRGIRLIHSRSMRRPSVQQAQTQCTGVHGAGMYRHRTGTLMSHAHRVCHAEFEAHLQNDVPCTSLQVAGGHHVRAEGADNHTAVVVGTEVKGKCSTVLCGTP